MMMLEYYKLFNYHKEALSFPFPIKSYRKRLYVIRFSL
jgi:hypothetical protein